MRERPRGRRFHIDRVAGYGLRRAPADRSVWASWASCLSVFRRRAGAGHEQEAVTAAFSAAAHAMVKSDDAGGARPPARRANGL